MIHVECVEVVRHVLDMILVLHMLMQIFPRETYFGASGACLWLELLVCVNLCSIFCMLVSVIRWEDHATSRFRFCDEGAVVSVRDLGDQGRGVRSPDSESCVLRWVQRL
jgi:hypothetical protein